MTATPRPSIIWQLGDPWRDLTAELSSASEPVTTVSESGAARIMLPGEWQVRIPLEGGRVMRRDLVRHPLHRILVATPCGIHTTDYAGNWHQSARLILVLAGEHPRWLLTAVGQQAFAKLRADGWVADGHQVGLCGARHCVELTARAGRRDVEVE